MAILTAFQKRFVAEVLITPQSESDAIRRAGYKGKNAGVRAAQLKAIPHVAEFLTAQLKKKYDKYEVTADRVIREISLLGFSNMDDYVEVDGDRRVLKTGTLTRDQMAAVCEITEDTTGGSGDGERKAVVRTKFKLYDKTKNLELLGRHLKLFTDVVKHEGLESLSEILAGRE
jgi:phage terminase small subunit